MQFAPDYKSISYRSVAMCSQTQEAVPADSISGHIRGSTHILENGFLGHRHGRDWTSEAAFFLFYNSTFETIFIRNLRVIRGEPDSIPPS